jgi:TrmH family RNA methyltransferase
MLSKNVVKDIQSLALKKHRDESGLFLAEGPKLVEELLDLIPGQIEQVYATESWGVGKSGVTIIDDHDIEKISALNTPNQVVAVVRKMTLKLRLQMALRYTLTGYRTPVTWGLSSALPTGLELTILFAVQAVRMFIIQKRYSLPWQVLPG